MRGLRLSLTWRESTVLGAEVGEKSKGAVTYLQISVRPGPGHSVRFLILSLKSMAKEEVTKMNRGFVNKISKDGPGSLPQRTPGLPGTKGNFFPQHLGTDLKTGL